MNLTLRALRHRNFALFFAGQAVALIGYWIQQVALTWLVYRLTGSAMLLGVLAFASNLPVLVLAPFAGLWSDRFDRHRMMVATQVFEMLQAIMLTVLAWTGAIEIWHIIALALFLGACVAVELPVRHAYLPQLVSDKTDLPNAIALTSLVANCGRLVGPVLAGLLIARFSEATCFLINALTYTAVLLSLALIRIASQPQRDTHPRALHGLKEGFIYAWHAVPIRLLLALLAFVAFSAAPYNALMPAIVHEAFAGGAETLGYLVGAAGMGAVCATLLLASRRGIRGLAPLIIGAALAAGCALMTLSWSRMLALSLALMAVIGFSILVISVSINIILQTIVEDDKRGRVMSLYTAAFLGIAPCGGLAAGALADRIGATHTVLIGGAICAAVAAYMARQLPRIQTHMVTHYVRESGAD